MPRAELIEADVRHYLMPRFPSPFTTASFPDHVRILAFKVPRPSPGLLALPSLRIGNEHLISHTVEGVGQLFWMKFLRGASGGFLEVGRGGDQTMQLQNHFGGVLVLRLGH
jgi:hypothetical protein